MQKLTPEDFRERQRCFLAFLPQLRDAQDQL